MYEYYSSISNMLKILKKSLKIYIKNVIKFLQNP